MGAHSTPFSAERLLRPEAFDHPVEHLQLLETHISWVILTGKYAYKIKKPVQFAFVDYSSLSRRHHFCQRELELNRRLAPDVYLEVVPITGTVDDPHMGGTGEPIEYAVKMLEFPQEEILAHRIDRGLVTPVEIDDLAGAIARFHAIAESLCEESPYGSAESIMLEAIKNFDAFDQLQRQGHLARDTTNTEKIGALRDWTVREFALRRAAFEFRRDSGATKLCHGDMHLGNIVRLGDRVEIFDGIEFNPSLQWIDCMSELAFPMMDLMHHGRADWAYRLINVYLEQTGDYGGLAVLRYYLVYRAMVRAKVDWLRQAQDSGSHRSDLPLPPEKPFLDLAFELKDAANPFLYITHGLSGSGKTTRAMQWCEQCRAIRIRSDIERTRLIKDRDHPDKYTPKLKRVVYDHLARLASRITRVGFPVVVDAAFLSLRNRDRFRRLAQKLGVPFGIIDCDATLDVLKQRVRKRRGDASEATIEVLLNQVQSRQPLTPAEQLECVKNPRINN